LFDRISNADIRGAVDELTHSLGVREEVTLGNLLAMLGRKEVEQCVQRMAKLIGLPVRIVLTYVAAGGGGTAGEAFESSALANTDSTGRGTEGITAQVTLPSDLPLYGTAGLENYPIRVRVSSNCCSHPYTFIAIMAHELSHVLLASLTHQHRDSELHTDLVAILLGFGQAVQRGRKIVEETVVDRVKHTKTTTFGYLNDSQFSYAYRYIADIRLTYRTKRQQLAIQLDKIVERYEYSIKLLKIFSEHIQYLDTTTPQRMDERDARRIVELHAIDPKDDWYRRLDSVRSMCAKAQKLTQNLDHYTTRTIDQIEEYAQSLRIASSRLEVITTEIKSDVQTLARYVGFMRRLRNRV